MILIAGDFVRIIAIAGLIAVPITYWIISNWPDGFAFRIQLAWWLFISPITIVLLIALGTISAQTIKAALVNPVKSVIGK